MLNVLAHDKTSTFSYYVVSGMCSEIETVCKNTFTLLFAPKMWNVTLIQGRRVYGAKFDSHANDSLHAFFLRMGQDLHLCTL